MKYFTLVIFFFLVSSDTLFAQNERLFIGLGPGMSVIRSFYQPNSSHPYDFILRPLNYKPYIAAFLTFQINRKISINAGYNGISYFDSYDIGRIRKGFLRNGSNGWGYTLYQFPLLLSYSFKLVEKPKYVIRFIPQLGVTYSITENVDPNAGHLTSVTINQSTGDTIYSSSGSYNSRLFTRKSFLPTIGAVFELEYFNRKNKIRKVLVSFTFGKGLVKLHEHVIGRNTNPVRLTTRGTFFEVSISQHFAIADLLPRKTRLKMQSRYLDSKAYKFFYLK